MMDVDLELIGYHFKEFIFDLTHVFARCELSAVRDTKNMRIYCDGGVTKSRVQNDVGCLGPNTWQSF